MRASSSGSPSVSISTRAMASTGGVTSATCRQRDRSVIAMSSGIHRRRAQQEHRRRRRLLDHLEQRVRRALGQPVGVLDHHDLPAAGRRAAATRSARWRASASTPMDSPSGMIRRTSAWVPAIVVVQARHSPQPGRAVGGALQRGGEAQRGDRAARSRRTGDQPRVGHRPDRAGSASPAVSGITAGRPRGGDQFRLHGVLAHQTRENTAAIADNSSAANRHVRPRAPRERQPRPIR